MTTQESAALGNEPLEALRKLNELEQYISRQRWQEMDSARDAGYSWSQIGEALGISRQAACQYYQKTGASFIYEEARKLDLTEEQALELVAQEFEAHRGQRSN